LLVAFLVLVDEGERVVADEAFVEAEEGVGEVVGLDGDEGMAVLLDEVNTGLEEPVAERGDCEGVGLADGGGDVVAEPGGGDGGGVEGVRGEEAHAAAADGGW